MAGRAATEAAGGNLPAAVTSFVGRRQELGQVRQCLSASRLVTLTGAGGVGKTRLAVEAAAQSRRAFADGVWLVDLAPLTDGALVTQAVMTELGIGQHTTRPVIDQVLEFLAERRLLIVLDNCEHVLDACAEMVDQLLRHCPGLRVLATSRQTLHISGEYVYPVPSLSVPDPAESVSVEALGQYEAVGLLVERAAAVQPGFTVNERNRDAVVQLCAGLDGIPLAIELAAIRLRALSIEQVVDRLADRFELLTGGSRAALARQRTLRALIDWSYDLCSVDEQRLWARISVFTREFDLEAAEEVCAGDGMREEQILDLVDSLVAQSIVTRIGTRRPTRFRMLETIRRYGLDRLVGFGEQDRVRDRHRHFFLRVAQRMAENWCGPEQQEALARMRADHGNLRSALEWSLADPAGAQQALELGGALCWHWCAGGFLSEGRILLDQGLAIATEPTPARARALWVAGWVALLQGDSVVVERRLDECRRLAEQVGDRAVGGLALSLAGSAAAFRGQPADAVKAFEQAIKVLTGEGENGVVLLTMFQLASDMLYMGDPDGATATALKAISISEKCGEHWGRSYALWVLARCIWLRGEPDEAWRLTQAALELQRGFRDSVGAALMIDQLAWIAASKREFTRAASLLGTAHSVWRSIATDVSAFGPGIAGHRTDCERQTESALREPAFQAAFERGMQRSVQEAIDYAAQRHEPMPRPQQQQQQVEVQVLTRREREVAELVGQGLSNRQTAERLVVSPRTVDGHVENILAKLGFTSRSQVAAWLAAQESRQENRTAGNR
jgi:predicted ATPase/DNA-binding CsgD family transcriptional regulator